MQFIQGNNRQQIYFARLDDQVAPDIPGPRRFVHPKANIIYLGCARVDILTAGTQPYNQPDPKVSFNIAFISCPLGNTKV